jgi:hypothetical protein
LFSYSRIAVRRWRDHLPVCRACRNEARSAGSTTYFFPT